MTRYSSIGRRRAALGQAVIPIALLALLALVGGLTVHARRVESSHRTTAQSALRDYAAFAVWQFSSEAAAWVHQTARVTLHVIDPLLRPGGAAQSLPPPGALVRWGDTTACGMGRAARYAFRLDLPGGELAIAGPEPPADQSTREALAARLTALAAPSPSAPAAPVRMLVDTLAGAPRVIAYAVVPAGDSLPRAVYGIEADPSALTEQLLRIARSKALLPPSLVGDRPIDSVLVLEVRRADGGLLVTVGEGPDSTLAARDTTPVEAGSLVTTVALRPGAASMLLIGGLPSSRLPMLLVLFAASVAVAGLALVQLRRGRELARLRTQFVASVSHELRTPLAQISMFSETLLLGRERSADERQHFLSVIVREARRLANLVERVLRFSRAEAGARPPRAVTRLSPAEPRDVAAEVRDAVRTFSPLAAAAGVELRTTVEEGSLARVEPDALRQVLLNLLDNAVKFGPEGQCVTVGVARANGDVVVSVADEGPGIPPPERQRVFAPFARGEQSHARAVPGAGIGLAVVAELVAAHAGRVWIEDAPGGRGTRVVFTLPTVAREPAAATP